MKNKKGISYRLYRKKTIEMAEEKMNLLGVNNKLDAISNNKTFNNINVVNKGYIKEGMIPVAMSNGLFKASYPFESYIQKINGKQAFANQLEIAAEDINYSNDKTVKAVIADLSEAVKSLYTYTDTLKKTLLELQQRVNDLTIKVESHINSGII